MFCSLFCLALPARAVEAPAAAPNRGALFKVEGGGHTLYLFGTIHVGAPDFYPLEARVTAALRDASTLALEVDPNGDPALMLGALRKYALYAGGGPAAADIAPSFKPRLERLLRQYAIPAESVAAMKPWMLASVLAISQFAALGYQPGLGIDAYLSRQAHERKIPVLELESMESQLALFGGLSLAEQCRFLEESIAAIEDQEQAAQAKEIAQAWRNADAAALDQLARRLADDDSFSGRFAQKVLLEQRNPGLAKGIAALLARESNTMAAIGVLHLVGANSVPALLRARGLKVERVY